MSRLSKISMVTITRQIAAAVKDAFTRIAGPAPVLIPIPVRSRRDTQLTRRIR